MDEAGADHDPGKYTVFVELMYESPGGQTHPSKVSLPPVDKF
jgi:hypothetical protein